MSVTRSRSLLFRAESAYNNGKLLRSLVLALIGIGWMIDDSTTGAGGWDYKEVDWVIGEDHEPIIQESGTEVRTSSGEMGENPG